MKRNYADLKIIIRDHIKNVPDSLDAYADSRSWQPLGDNHERETIDGDKVLYSYSHDKGGKLPDSARASLIRKNGRLETAYIHGVYSEDFGIQGELNKMLGIKLKRLSRR